MTQPQPPTSWRYAYRLLGLRLPDEYRPWVAEDVTSRSYLTWRILRAFLWGIAVAGLYDLAQAAIITLPTRPWLFRQFLVALAVALVASRDTLVRRTLRWQRVDKHGRPARPRRLAVLGNAEAVVLVTALAVLITGVSAVWASGLRPSGPSAAKCHKPDAATAARLTAGLKKPGATLVAPQVVKFAHGQVVAAFVASPASPRPAFVGFIIQNGNIFELRQSGQTAAEKAASAAAAASTFPAPPSADRIAVTALQAAVSCLGRAGPR